MQAQGTMIPGKVIDFIKNDFSLSPKLSSADILHFFDKEKEEKRVLLVEDDISQIDLIEELINDINPDVSVDAYLTAEEALEAIEMSKKLENEKSYDVIISDVFLKGAANGIDLWSYCKEYFPKSPVVIISSFDEPTLKELFSGEFDEVDYIQKPISFEMFNEQVGRKLAIV